MSQGRIEESLALLEGDWDVDPVIRDFMLGRITDVSDRQARIGEVTFHIPYLGAQGRYVLWKCFWPDCHNCCNRQGRLPLTSDDLITIGAGLKYARRSDFVREETLTVTHTEPAPSGRDTTMTTINLRRRDGETEGDDGTHIRCRFLGEDGACGIHPSRPGVCYLYPFSTWLENDGGTPRIHATFQFTGDCPGFYLAESADPMRAELEQYSGIIRDYTMASMRTNREGFGSVSIG